MDWEPQGFNFLTSYFLTLPNLTGLNRPLSLLFYPQDFWVTIFLTVFYLNFEKLTKRGGPILELLVAFLIWPNLTELNRPLSPVFHPLTPPWGEGGHYKILKERFFRGTTYPELGVFNENLLKK
jgi:hypothetical protein